MNQFCEYNSSGYGLTRGAARFAAELIKLKKGQPLIRRDFIKVAGAALAAAALPETQSLAGQQVVEGRDILPMNRNWRYRPAQAHGAESPAYDDSAFERIVVPHTNIQLPWHSFDDKDYEFISTYRRRFKFPRSAVGKRVFVDFEGVMTASTAWINGVRLG